MGRYFFLKKINKKKKIICQQIALEVQGTNEGLPMLTTNI